MLAIASLLLFAADEPAVDFTRDVRPILASRCFACHGPDDKARKAGLRLDLREHATKKLRSGFIAIIPGDLERSDLVTRITSADPGLVMPPARLGNPLKPAEIEVLRRWVKQGAKYDKHWAWIPPVRPTVPSAPPGLARNPIDAFLLARLTREKLTFSPEASPAELLRRVSLDLTGLPPSLADADAFLNDRRPGAYERAVDRLLASPAFGERWAAPWLDLARYADSQGFANDPDRQIWPWRDWVVRALNDNMPYSQFTIEQLAGDLLPDATDDQKIATGFHRNTLTNTEGGTNAEEFRSAAIVDRVNTTFQVWMGTTMACAQCHNHKYDPLTQKEYFQAYAIFNNCEDANTANDAPFVEMALPGKEGEQAGILLKLLVAQAELKKASEYNKKSAMKKVADLQAELKKVTVTTPVLKELAKPRTTHIHRRGDFLDKGEAVGPGLPALFPGPEKPNRLDLARWLVSEKNPLTARVAVNRLWEEAFGIGLVESSEEFGTQGDLPSHPELLDWLATEMIRSGWDMKGMLRLLVTSAAYRQSSKVTDELAQRDPRNRLLARGPRARLSAEAVRDQALFASGLLSPVLGGPPVQPPRPNFGLSAAFGSGTDWTTSPGTDRHRRGLYTRWRRNAPYPSFTTFDAPERTSCSVRRSRTNTPLQALVTLNDPVFVEAAQALGRRALAGAESLPARLTLAFRLVLTRPPTELELRRLTQLYEAAKKKYDSAPALALALATKPIGPAPAGASHAELAAWTVVGNVLLNLDETLNKR
jgi:hypothetical protein